MELKIGKAGGRDFFVDAQELVTGRTCIIAQSGAGKSWSIAVLCEKMCRNHIGFCLIDTEGEYYSLKEKYPDIWWVGAEGGDSDTDDIKMDYDIEKVNIGHLLKRAVSESRPVIYDVSEVDMVPRVTKMVHELYQVATEQRRPYLLIVEEADKFIPQSKDSIKKIEEISRRGRKRGLGLMVATQRPAIVTKNVLSQCNNQIIGKLSIDNDLKAVGLFFSSKQEVEELTNLNPGDFFVMGNLVREKTKMRFGRRETEHRGLTPLLEHREISNDDDFPEDDEAVPDETEGRLFNPDTEDSFENDEIYDFDGASESSDAAAEDFDGAIDDSNTALDYSDAEFIEDDRIIDFDYEPDDTDVHDDAEIIEDDIPALPPSDSEHGLLPAETELMHDKTAGAATVSGHLDTAETQQNAGKKKKTKKAPAAKKAKTVIAERVENDAVLPLISRENALFIVKKNLNKWQFRETERLISADLIYLPIIEVHMKYIGGIIRKNLRYTSYLIDGRTAESVSVESGLKHEPFLEEYIGLDEEAALILDTMDPRGVTAAEIEADTGYEKETVAKAIADLKKKKLITDERSIGKMKEKSYIPLISKHIPNIREQKISFDLKRGSAEGGFIEKRTVEESDLRVLFKIMESTSEITKFNTFYYPVWKVMVTSEHDDRTIIIDAVTGREISL